MKILPATGHLLVLIPFACGAQTLYDFGNPSADEQLYIELINRARANPSAEGARLASTTDPDVLLAINNFGVNLQMMQDEFNGTPPNPPIPPAPPIAPNAILTSAARTHSAWMLANNTQSHDQDGVPFYTRIINAGYSYNAVGENVFAYAKNPWHGHAGFQIDWGSSGTGGMQDGRGHRTTIHNPAFREVGVGVTYGSGAAVGPTQVTQDFGSRSSGPAFGTGVAYYDLDGNNFYDAGEGISGLTVNVAGASHYCVTAAGGGWVVPVPADAASRNVTFSGLNISHTSGLSFPGSANAKLDLRLTYSPPSFTTSSTASTGTLKTVSFTPVGGATGYKWRRWNPSPAAAENCESIAGITYQNYKNPLVTNLFYQGAASFHLQNGSPAGNRWIQLNRLFRAGASPAMNFRSCVRWATAAESFRVQLKEENTEQWIDVYSQTGTGNSGEGTTFHQRFPDLSAFANKTFRVRFLLRFNQGGGYYAPDVDTGWYIDAIQFGGINQLENETATDLAGTTGTFTPSSTGSVFQGINPIISAKEFPAVYQTLTVSSGPPPGFAAWAANIESLNSLPAGSISAPGGDHDKDGRVNLLEYAFGTSPILASEAAPRWPVRTGTSPDFTIDYQRDTSLTDLTFASEASTALGTWHTPGQPGAPAGFTDQLVSTSGTIETRRATLPLTTGAKGFLRVRVTQNP